MAPNRLVVVVVVLIVVVQSFEFLRNASSLAGPERWRRQLVENAWECQLGIHRLANRWVFALSPPSPPLSILLFPPIPVPPLPPFLSKYHRPLVSFFSSPASFQFSPVRYSPGTLYFTTAARAYRETTARKEVEKKVFKGARIRVRRVWSGKLL